MVFNLPEQIILFVFIAIASISFFGELYKRYVIVMNGTGKFEFTNLPVRLKRVVLEFILQKKVISQRFWPGLMHAFVFWGFMFFSIITIDHFLIGFNIHLFSNSFKHTYANFIGIPWAIFVLIGIISLAYRRFVTKPKYLGDKISYTSGLVAIFICVLMLTYIIDITYATESSGILLKINWWIHAILILGFLILIPKSKHLHLVLSPINIL